MLASSEDQPATAKDANLDTATTVGKKLDDLYQLIDGIDVCMFTTRSSSGELASRPMATQARIAGADLWFAANNLTNKFDDLSFDNHVNLGYFRQNNRDWVSVSGTATKVDDREMIRKLWNTNIATWFNDLGDNVHDGGPDDPRISLIFVQATSVHYAIQDRTTPLVLWELAKGAVTGNVPKVQAIRQLDASDLEAARRVDT
ncbi:bli-3 protein, partial [Gonapodya prolifera JEL478]